MADNITNRVQNSTERDPLLGDRKPRNDEEAHSNADHSNSDEAEPLIKEPTTSELVLVLCGTWLGSFLAAMDSTIIATLTAPISASFDSLSLVSWLASSYFIANAALQPLSGRLTDIVSRKWGLIFSNVTFAAGNLICGLAQREWVMIFGRVVAGCGGGGLTAISTFVGSDLVPLRRRGVWQGVGNVCFGLGAGLGAVLGGWINDVWGWRKAFLILVPFTVLSCILVTCFVNIPVKQSERSAWKRIDFLGAFGLITTLVLLLIGLNSGGTIVPWNHPLIYTTLPLSAVSLFAFIYVENTHALEPIIPIKVVANRTVLAACFTNWFLTMSIFSVLYFAPIYFQIKGLSTTQAGIRLVPQSLGAAVGSISTGLIMRWTGRYYYLTAAIMLIFIVANVLVASFNLDTPLWVTIVALGMTGIGYAGMLTVTLIAFISAVAHEHQAVVTSASYAFRSTGSAIGITIASAVFQNLVSRNLQTAIGDRQGAADVIRRLKDNLEVIKHLPEGWKGDVQQAYMDSVRGVFLTTLGISVVGAAVSLLMREHTLYATLSRK
ncbi:uncharacterized protein KY384_002721 [Bacidia gigantensis]|uniref:uncharacterized protein n=1 Tax=Bacidia gigantensis TaxID=2732470 RepID=UPI001D056946|nr:uncharacterized protein KY384_002721 [Bacidia gigantensis]KAG8532843.1 hypothetical protein KY384_002721 [Bacidia gigantensis]